MIKHPSWLKIRLPAGKEYFGLKAKLKELNLHTVCESTKCPNIAKCWANRNATIMILGDICTRNCKFCAVKHGNPNGHIDEEEPFHVAEAAKYMNLNYIVITSVNRDDLKDGGAMQFNKTINEIKKLNPDIKVEALIPDFKGEKEYWNIIINSKVDVISHNLETTRRLTPLIRDKKASYTTSLNLLKYIKEKSPYIITKSGFMLGLGESINEVVETLNDLNQVSCNIVTIGQYLQPSKDNVSVKNYIPPEVFRMIKDYCLSIGFMHVESGPLVRSSYMAHYPSL